MIQWRFSATGSAQVALDYNQFNYLGSIQVARTYLGHLVHYNSAVNFNQMKSFHYNMVTNSISVLFYFQDDKLSFFKPKISFHITIKKMIL